MTLAQPVVPMGVASKLGREGRKPFSGLFGKCRVCPPSAGTDHTDSGGGLGRWMQGERFAKEFSLSL